MFGNGILRAIAAGLVVTMISFTHVPNASAFSAACRAAEAAETAGNKLVHDDCIKTGNNCDFEDKLLCQELQLVQKVCGRLTDDEEKHLAGVRRHQTCKVPGH